MQNLHSIPREGAVVKRGRKRRLPTLTEQEKHAICVLLDPSNGYHVRIRAWDNGDGTNTADIQVRASWNNRGRFHAIYNIQYYAARYQPIMAFNFDWDKIKVTWVE